MTRPAVVELSPLATMNYNYAMNDHRSLRLACALLATLLLSPALTRAAAAPNVFYADPLVLAEMKTRFATNDASFKPAFDKLFSDADKALKTKPVSVMDKKKVPPNGDKHDFVSQAPYFWKDTNSPSGRYIRKDGERNPESNVDSDAGRLSKVSSGAGTLALAYYFSGQEKYAAHAAELLRVWFLNPATRMNPRLDYGQGIPGQVDGRPEGVLQTRGLVEVVDAIGLLRDSKAWTAADQTGMEAWVEKYLAWVTTSKIGRAEGNASNNHGSHYDVQVTALALFVGQTNVAREILATARQKRIAQQIERDGKQPRELARTTSLGYSLFNLRALMDLASLGKNCGVDLWHFETSDGRSIRRALEYVSPYADPARKWPHQQIHAANLDGLAELLLRAAPEYPEANFAEALKFFPADTLAANRVRLLFRTAPCDNSASVRTR